VPQIVREAVRILSECLELPSLSTYRKASLPWAPAKARMPDRKVGANELHLVLPLCAKIFALGML
jgi:hypothetical protein